jgi:RNA polymerase sigma factor (sigma-70 family)
VTDAAAQALLHGSIAELTRADRTDDQLLGSFVQTRDQAAFGVLVRRHGPMVLGVCRRVLRNSADADDAFQAAFLVLAQKAATIGHRELLARWLYGVAFNTARRLRRTSSRRSLHEKPFAEIEEPCAGEASHLDREVVATLDEELSRLPDRYRLPIVLCDLEGLARREAARQLGCPEGTVAGSLARARVLLASRLTKRGLAPAGSFIGAVLSDQGVSAVSSALLARVVRVIGAPELKSAVATGLVSQQVAETSEGVVRAMFLNKLKTYAFALVLCGVAVAGIVGLVQVPAAAQTDPVRPLTGPARPLAGEPPTAADPVKPAIPDVSPVKTATVVSLKKLNAKETAEKLTGRLPKAVTVFAARDENVLIVYATAAGTEEVHKVLEELGEKRSAVTTSNPNPEKKFAIKFTEAPWDNVLTWYCEASGLTPVFTVKPTGKVTILPAVARQFTLGEVTDLINEALMQQKFLLIRRKVTFTLVPADEKIHPMLATQTSLEDLKDRGATEFVEVHIPGPATVRAKDVVTEFTPKLLTPFGTAFAFEKTNTVVVMDVAGNVRRIARIIDAVDESETRQKVTL